MFDISGILIGILSSVFAWWILNHSLSPKIVFADKLLCVRLTANTGSSERYLIAFENIKRRAVIDLEIKAYINVRLDEMNIPSDGRNLYVNLSVTNIPRLGGKMSTGVTLHPEKTEEMISGSLSGYFNNAEDITLENIMSIPGFEGLYIVVYGYDDFSGARKLFKSKAYDSGDLTSGSE